MRQYIRSAWHKVSTQLLYTIGGASKDLACRCRRHESQVGSQESERSPGGETWQPTPGL